MFDQDVPTGTLPIEDEDGEFYQSKLEGTKQPELPSFPTSIPPVECTLWATASSCTEEQLKALMDGSAVVENDIVISPKGVEPNSSKRSPLIGLDFPASN